MTKLLIPLLLLITAGAAAQQHKRDPLNDLEIDKVRDAAQTPDVRLKLYVEFARARLDKIQQVRSDPKAENRDEAIGDNLQDFIDIFDELDDNVDTFADRGEDLRKALKPVIEADTEFGAKLRALKGSLATSRDQAAKFDFLVNSALQAVDDAAKDHRDLLAEQETKFKDKKEKEKERKHGSKDE
jgi:hypothetical protein